MAESTMLLVEQAIRDAVSRVFSPRDSITETLARCCGVRVVYQQ